MKPLRSSMLNGVSYDADTEKLRVQFTNRTIYEYYNVPEHIYKGLLNAQSHGSYFTKFIKKKGYEYRRV